MFVVKARAVEKLGAVGGVVIDNNDDTSASSSPLFAMSGDGSDGMWYDVFEPSISKFILSSGFYGQWHRKQLHIYFAMKFN